MNHVAGQLEMNNMIGASSTCQHLRNGPAGKAQVRCQSRLLMCGESRVPETGHTSERLSTSGISVINVMKLIDGLLSCHIIIDKTPTISSKIGSWLFYGHY